MHERVLEVLRLPECADRLGDRCVRRDVLQQLFAEDDGARRVYVGARILLPHAAQRPVHGKLGGCRVNQLVADAACGRDEVVDVLELVAQVLVLAEHIRTGGDLVFVADVEAETARRQITF